MEKDKLDGQLGFTIHFNTDRIKRLVPGITEEDYEALMMTVMEEMSEPVERLFRAVLIYEASLQNFGKDNEVYH